MHVYNNFDLRKYRVQRSVRVSTNRYYWMVLSIVTFCLLKEKFVKKPSYILFFYLKTNLKTNL